MFVDYDPEFEKKHSVTLTRDNTMYTFVAFYKGRRVTVEASTTYTAQCIAAKLLKAKKYYDVAVVRADIELDPATI